MLVLKISNCLSGIPVLCGPSLWYRVVTADFGSFSKHCQTYSDSGGAVVRKKPLPSRIFPSTGGEIQGNINQWITI